MVRSTGSTHPAQFIEATHLISDLRVPFGQAHSTGVQWSRLKDSLPAPAGYIQDLLAQWNQAGQIEQEMAALATAQANVASGWSKLAAFALMAQSGFDILHA